MAHDDDAATAAAIYFDAWQARDFARLRSVLADDVDFAGPLGQVRGGDECLRGLQGLSEIMTGIQIQKVFTAGPDVLTWYDMATAVADPVPVANWMQVKDGKITYSRTVFDSGPLVAARPQPVRDGRVSPCPASPAASRQARGASGPGRRRSR